MNVEWKEVPTAAGASRAEFSKTCSSIDELKNLMVEAQELVKVSSATQISSNVVHVKICSPNVVDLTIVDLPGLVRTTGKDENPEIVHQIRKLIDSYLVNTRCVILAVHPANVDFHNSQVIADAQQHDKSTRRTFPVVTKADLVEPGNEKPVLDLLLQKKTERFELGFHLVKCRSPKELADGMTVAQSLETERHFFAEKWLELADSDKGVAQLQKKLGQKYFTMLAEFAPAIKQELASRLAEYARQVKAAYVPRTMSERDRAFRAVIERVASDVRLFDSPACCDEGMSFSETTTFRSHVEAHKLKFFNELVHQAKDENFLATEKNILERVIATKKCEPRAFVDQGLFVKLIREELTAKWEPIVQRFLAEITAIIKRFFDKVNERILNHCMFPNLSLRLRTIISAGVEECIDQGREAALKSWMEMSSGQPLNNHYLSETIQQKRAKDSIEELRKSCGKVTRADKSEYAAVDFAIIEQILLKNSTKSIDEYFAEEALFALSGYLKTLAKLAGDNIPMTVERQLIHCALTKIDFNESIPIEEREELLAAAPGAEVIYEDLRRKHAALEEAVKQARLLCI